MLAAALLMRKLHVLSLVGSHGGFIQYPRNYEANMFRILHAFHLLLFVSVRLQGFRVLLAISCGIVHHVGSVHMCLAPCSDKGERHSGAWYILGKACKFQSSAFAYS